MSHVAQMDESRHTHTNESCHTCHVTHVNESRTAYESVTFHIRMSHVTHITESCPTYE